MREFGGPAGALAILLFSHAVLYYLWIAWRFHGGAVHYPDGLGDVGPYLARAADQIATHAAPTWRAVAVYWGFLVAHAVGAVVMPGPKVRGLAVPALGGAKLEYRCNALFSWYATLLVVGAAHVTGVFSLDQVFDQFGSYMTVAVVSGDVVAVAIYAGARITKNTHRMSGNTLYDFFMGAWLNPRIGRLDLKMWAEIRISWILLWLLTASAAAKQYAEHGTISAPMILIVLAHGLYTNAACKGEECVPTTWDIFYEKWGWMLIFWNFAGVPFVYCFNAMYLAQRSPFEHSAGYTALVFVLLLCAYYVWDTSQSQRHRFRMQMAGTYVKRRAFPQLPWGTLRDPRYLETKSGSLLLIDGWCRYARKIHYTADITQALCWGLICGFDHALPYFYFVFFTGMILHRTHRDVARCRQKYGEDWDRYVEAVPWLFVPKVF